MNHAAWLAGLLSAGLPLAQADAAALKNIRIARHAEFVRIVLDLDAAVSFSAIDGAFTLTGLDAESAVMNAAPADRPLTRVRITPADGGARLSFETATPVTPKAFTLTPDSDGGHRLVVDLYPAPGGETHEREARPSRGSAEDAHSGPASPSGTSAALPAATPPHSAETPGPTLAAVPGIPFDPRPETTSHSAAASPVARPEGPGYSQETLRAERALDRGDAKEACALVDGALKANANDLRALVVLGTCRLAQQDGAGARGAFASALAQDPAYDRARVGLATALDMMGDASGARSELSQVLGHGIPPEELARLLDAFKSLRPTVGANVTPEPDAAPQRIVNNRAPAIVRGPSD